MYPSFSLTQIEQAPVISTIADHASIYALAAQFSNDRKIHLIISAP